MSVGPGSSSPPAGWNRTIGDLMAEMSRGERSSISGEEAGWAREYERSLLPPDVVFPRDGEVWEAVDDAEVLVMHHYAAPVTDTSEAVLPAGERVRVIGAGQDRPIVVSAEPLRHDELLARLVPDDVRAEPRFTNYSLMVKTEAFNQHFRRIADTAGG